MDWLLRRLREASTWLGLGGAVAVLGEAWKVNEAPGVAEALNQTGQMISQGLPWYQWLPIALGSALAIVLKDKAQ